MNETQIADRLRELEARVNALEGPRAAWEIPPMPDAPRRYQEAVFLLVVLVLLPAHAFGCMRLAAWAERLGVRVFERGIKIAARRGTLAQRAHGARVFGGRHV
jgi:hypothetical protein